MAELYCYACNITSLAPPSATTSCYTSATPKMLQSWSDAIAYAEIRHSYEAEPVCQHGRLKRESMVFAEVARIASMQRTQ
jgi:hypothetical protein